MPLLTASANFTFGPFLLWFGVQTKLEQPFKVSFRLWNMCWHCLRCILDDFDLAKISHTVIRAQWYTENGADGSSWVTRVVLLVALRCYCPTLRRLLCMCIYIYEYLFINVYIIYIYSYIILSTYYIKFEKQVTTIHRLSGLSRQT